MILNVWKAGTRYRMGRRKVQRFYQPFQLDEEAKLKYVGWKRRIKNIMLA